MGCLACLTWTFQQCSVSKLRVLAEERLHISHVSAKAPDCKTQGTQHEIMVSLHEIHRVLKIGGRLIITLDNLANPVIALRSILPFSLLNRLGLVPYYVGATLSPSHLCRILEKSGFKVAEIDAVMHCPRVLAVAMASILQKYAGAKTQKRFLRALTAFEHLSRFPTRFLTGYFVAVKAIKY